MRRDEWHDAAATSTQAKKRSKSVDTSGGAPVPISSRTAGQLPLAGKALELRAFGLEDRAEAVMAVGDSSWRLDRLAQWRQQMLQPPPTGVVAASTLQYPQQEQASPATAAAASSQAYLKERQRQYRQHMLQGRTPSPSPSPRPLSPPQDTGMHT